MILVMVGVPPEGIGLILGVDRLLDMCRTTLNVAGDLVIATVVSRSEPDEADADQAGPVTTAVSPAAPHSAQLPS
jgi:Na+/H+-dicarboxylate symporter